MGKEEKIFAAIAIITIIIVFIIYQVEINSFQFNDEEQTLTYALPFDFTEYSQFAPQSYATDQILSAVSASLYSPSLHLDRYYAPNLAIDMPEISDNNTVFTVTLKSDLMFSDGTTLTVDDVVFTYQSLLSPAINKNNYEYYKSNFKSNDSISRIDESKVRFEIIQNRGIVLSFLSAYIQPKIHFQEKLNNHNYDWNSDDYSDSISAGPYIINNFDKDSMRVEFIKNQYYWDVEDIVSDKLIMMKILDKTHAIEALQNGDVNILDSHYMLGKNELDSIREISEDFIAVRSHTELSLNHLHPYFGTGELLSVENKTEGSKSIRKAMSHIIDRQFIVESIFEGMVLEAATIVPPAFFGWNSKINPREFSLNESRDYMIEAGFNYTELGTPDVEGIFPSSFFNITVLEINDETMEQEWIDLFVQELPKIGIGVDHVVMDWNEILLRTYDSDIPPPIYEYGGYDLVSFEFDWDDQFIQHEIYNSSKIVPNGRNIYNFNNTTLDEINTRLINTIDNGERNKIMSELQKFYYEWEITIPIYFPLEHWAYSDYLAGYDTVLLSDGRAEWNLIGEYSIHLPQPSFGEFFGYYTFWGIVIIFGIMLISYIVIIIRQNREKKIFKT